MAIIFIFGFLFDGFYHLCLRTLGILGKELNNTSRYSNYIDSFGYSSFK
jgi:hypothetical protein